jgi:hypothetical protein
MKKVSVDLFRAAPYMLMLVLHKDVLFHSVQVSVSTIFYEQLFHTKVFCAALTCLQFGFVNFWRKDFGARAANKMLMKWAPVVAGRHERYFNSIVNEQYRTVPSRMRNENSGAILFLKISLKHHL